MKNSMSYQNFDNNENSIREAKQLSPLTLAFIGDAVYEILVRQAVVNEGNAPVHKLHFNTVKFVKASAQAKAVEMIEPMLTDEEKDILRRGRNTSSMTVPKSAEPREYRLATGLEALFGYLHLSGQEKRAEELFEIIYISMKGE